MRKLLLLVAFIVAAPVSLAQAQDYSNYEFFVGYTHERNNNGADRLDTRGASVVSGVQKPVDFQSRRIGYNGFSTEFVQNLNRYVGLVTSFTGTYHRFTFGDRLTGRGFPARLAMYTLMAGPRVNFRNSSPVTPYVHGLFGIAHYRASFDDTSATGAIFNPRSRSETSFGMALGGGLDVNVSEHVDIRAGEADYVPTFFGDGRQDNLRFTFGVKIK